MDNGTQIIIGMLLVFALPVFLGFIWMLRRSQLRRRADRDMKTGNQIYSQLRRNGVDGGVNRTQK